MPRTILFDGQEITPPKIFCIGRNYAKHIEELGNVDPGEIVVFLKPNSAIGEKIVLPDEEMRYEGEICFLIEDSQITGVGFGLDMTKVETQKRLKNKGLPWEKSKAFPHSALFSTFIPLDSWENLSLRLYLNDELRQNAPLSLMLYKPDTILADLQRHFVLEDFDIIMSGTPEGVGTVHPGDQIRGELYRGEEKLLSHLF